MMKILIVRVISVADAFRERIDDAAVSIRGNSIGSELIFYSVEQLAKTLIDTNRWKIISVIEGTYSMSIRDLSRLVNLDFFGVYNDVQMLISECVLNKDGETIVLPYDRLKIMYNSDDMVA